MAKTKISEFSTTAGNNTDINSINIAEGCAPSGINDAIRELMRQLKEFQTGGAGDSVNSGGDFSVATNKFTVASASGNTAVAGTLAVTGVATLTAQPILSSLTASKAVFTDASKGLVSNDVTGTGNVVMSNSPTLVTPALGTPASGVVTNLTGTASININGTVGATTPSTGAFTTLSSTGNTTLGDASGDTITVNGTTTFVNANPTLSAGTANGVLYLNGSKVATSGSALTFDGANLGIGSTSPQGQLSLGSAASGQKGLTLDWTGAGGPYAVASFTADRGTGEIRNFAYTNFFQTWYSNNTEKMRLDTSGNLGIGTSSPSAKLHVDSGATGLMGLFNSTNANGGYITGQSSGTAIWDFGTAKQTLNTGGASDVGINTRSGFLAFGTANTERMRLDTSGNLGLGVTPSAWTTYTAQQIRNASVYGWSGGNSFAALAANTWYGGSPAGYRYISTDFATEYYQYQGAHIWRTAPSGTAGDAITFTQAMTLNASGNLGVGITSPVSLGSSIATIDIGSTNGGGIRFRTSGAGNSAYLLANSSGVDLFTADAVYMRFGTSGTERARIDSSGNLIQSAPTTAPTLSTNGTMVFNLTSNTNLRVSVRGSDGVTRTANITLA